MKSMHKHSETENENPQATKSDNKTQIRTKTETRHFLLTLWPLVLVPPLECGLAQLAELLQVRLVVHGKVLLLLVLATFLDAFATFLLCVCL